MSQIACPVTDGSIKLPPAVAQELGDEAVISVWPNLESLVIYRKDVWESQVEANLMCMPQAGQAQLQFRRTLLGFATTVSVIDGEFYVDASMLERVGIGDIAWVARRGLGFALSTNDDVNYSAIQQMLATADRLVVKREPLKNSPVLYISDDPSDVNALAEAVKKENLVPSFHCWCIGAPAIEFYRNGNFLGQITNHHGVAIRTSVSRTDLGLVSAAAYQNWFARRSIELGGNILLM